MNRGATPVVAIPLLVAVTVLLVAVVGTVAFGIASPPEPAEPVALDATATADGRLTLVHEAGHPIDVTTIELRIAVDGEALAHQPPIPFDGAEGFRWAPSGPFNRGADPRWEVGEEASLVIAGTNDPELRRGVTVTVRLVRDGVPFARVETTVRPT